MIGPLLRAFDARDGYWFVAGDEMHVYSSARAQTVAAADETYQAWLASGAIARSAATMDDVIAELRAANVPPYHLVPTRLIVDRLQAAGKLAAARAALDAADLYTRERWNNRVAIFADDATAKALIQGVNADPAVILAPE